MTDCLFAKQNFWIRSIITATGSISAIAVPDNILIVLWLSLIIFLLPSPRIYLYVAKGLRILLPFFAAYSLFALLFEIPYISVLVFLLRMIILVAFVVYFSVSLSLMRLLEDVQKLVEHNIFKSIFLYCLSTIMYMKRFTDYYKTGRKTRLVSVGYSSSLVSTLLDSIHANWQLRNQILMNAEALMKNPYNKPNFFSLSNIWGCFYITVLFLILSL